MRQFTLSFIAASCLFAMSGTLVAGHAAKHHGGIPHPPISQHHHGQIEVQKKARLGVAISKISLAELDRLGLEYGVRVAQVMGGSVADRAGIQTGDVITAFADRPTYSPERLAHLVQTNDGEQTVTLKRGDNELTLLADFAESRRAVGNAILGVRVQAMTTELQEAFGVADGRGVLIAKVSPASGAAQAGITAGDILVSVDGDAVSSVGDIRAALADQAAGNSIAIELVRERQTKTLDVVLSGSASKPSSAFVHPLIGHGHHPHLGMLKKHGCSVRPSAFKG